MLEQALQACLSEKKEERQAAERYLEQQLSAASPQKQKDACTTGLVGLLKSSPHAPVRSLSAVLLRSKLTKGNPTIFLTLSQPVQELAKTTMLQCITTESTKLIRNQICDTVSEIAFAVLFAQGGSWDQLLPFLHQCYNSGQDHLICAALFLFGRLCEGVYGKIAQHLPKIVPLYHAALDPKHNIKVRIQSITAISQTMCALEEHEVTIFDPSITRMLRLLQDVLNSGIEQQAQDTIQIMVDISTEQPTFFRNHLNDLLAAMTQIGQTQKLEDDTRQLALEFLVTVSENASGMVRKNRPFIENSLKLCLLMMLDIQDDPKWNTVNFKLVSTDDSNHDCGETSLDRISQALGGESVIPILFPILQQFFGNGNDWRYRYAALMALTQVGEVLEWDKVPEMMKVTLTFFDDGHHRVRYAAVHCLGQFSTDHGPDLQNHMHKEIMGGILKLFSDTKNPRIQAHAAAALINFAEHCTKELLQPYLDPLLSKLFELLKSNNRSVQEQVITAVASMADSAKTYFDKYFDHFVPLLMQIIGAATQKELLEFRGRALECISFIGMSVGRERFRTVANQIMQITVQMIESKQIEPDDQCYKYLLQSWTRICTTIGPGFLPYMDHVMPIVLKAAQVECRAAEIDEEDENIEVYEFGTTQIAINHSLIEEKVIACSMLSNFAEDLQEKYFKWLQPTSAILIPLIKYPYEETVRNHCSLTMPSLVKCALKSHIAGTGASLQNVQELFASVLENLMSGMRVEVDMHVLMSQIKSVQMVLKESSDLVRQSLNKEKLSQIVQELLRVLNLSYRRMSSREERRKHPDFDEIEEQMLKEEIDLEDALCFQVTAIMSELISIFKDLFAPVFEQCAQGIIQMLDPNITSQMKRTAVYIFDDIMEFLSPQLTVKYLETFMPKVWICCADPSPEVRQAAYYGLGIMAERCAEGFAPYANKSCDVCFQCFKTPPTSDLCINAADNALSAVCKITQHQAGAVELNKIHPLWLSLLPIRRDKVEALKCHQHLCHLVERKLPTIIGANGELIPKILNVFSQIIGTPMTSDQITTFARNFATQTSKLPAQIQQEIAKSLSAEQKAKLGVQIPEQHNF